MRVKILQSLDHLLLVEVIRLFLHTLCIVQCLWIDLHQTLEAVQTIHLSLLLEHVTVLVLLKVWVRIQIITHHQDILELDHLQLNELLI